MSGMNAADRIVEWESCPSHAGVQRFVYGAARGAWADSHRSLDREYLARISELGYAVRGARCILIDRDEYNSVAHQWVGQPLKQVAMPFANTWIEVRSGEWRDHRCDAVFVRSAGPGNPILMTAVERNLDYPNVAHPTATAFVSDEKGLVLIGDRYMQAEALRQGGEEAKERYENDLRIAGQEAVGIVNVVGAWLASTNVDLGDMPLSRQVRRGAVRAGRQIPKVIHVKRRQRRKHNSATEHSVGYSHRFEVRAHFQHHNRGPIWNAWKDTDKVFDHPDIGPCVQVWNPGCIKGPNEKPLIPKLRIVTNA